MCAEMGGVLEVAEEDCAAACCCAASLDSTMYLNGIRQILDKVLNYKIELKIKRNEFILAQIWPFPYQCPFSSPLSRVLPSTKT